MMRGKALVLLLLVAAVSAVVPVKMSTAKGCVQSEKSKAKGLIIF